MKYFVLTCKRNVWLSNGLCFIKDKSYDAVATKNTIVTLNELKRPHVIATTEIYDEFKEHFDIDVVTTWDELCHNPMRQKRVEQARRYLNKIETPIAVH